MRQVTKDEFFKTLHNIESTTLQRIGGQRVEVVKTETEFKYVSFLRWKTGAIFGRIVSDFLKTEK